MRLSPSAILIPIAIAVAACGSTSTSGAATPTPKPTPVPKADAICQTYDTTISGLTPPVSDVSSPASASELPGIATWLDKVLTDATQEQTALKAEPGAAPINTAFGDVLTTLTAVNAAAKAGDLAAYKSAYANYITANNTLSNAAKAAKLPDCA